LYQKYHKHSDF